MRRFAGRFAALVLALLMLLSSMPLTALAEQVVPSKSFDIDVSTTGVEPAPATSKTAAELAQEAVNAAATGNQDGAYLNIYSAAPPSEAVETGAPFNYTIGMQFGAAPTYTDPVSGAQQAAYTKYENVKITVTAPNHIELIKDGQRAQSFIYELSDDGEPGSSKTLTVGARMTNNGVAKDGFDYGALEVKIEAEITSVFGGDPVKIEYTFETDHEKNTSGNVTNTASAEWRVTKTMPETDAFEENAANNTVTVKWNIAVSRTDDECNTTGTLNFAEFLLTDTLPKANDKYPTDVTVTSGGEEITIAKVRDADNNLTGFTTTHYATTALTGDAANAAKTPTPAATTYTVTAVYPRAAFVLDWGETTKISVENTATLNYTLVGETATPPVKSEASGEYGIETPGGDLTIVEKLDIAGTKEVPYNSYYAQLFTQPNDGVQFKVYRQNEETKDYDLVQTVAVTVGADGASVTLTNLEPGNYQIEQITRPEGSNAPKSLKQDVTIVSGKKDHELTFINPTPAKRILTIEKRDSAGKLIAIEDESKRAQFEVKVESSDVNAEHDVTVNADGQYVLAIDVSSTDKTTVTITETAAPDGYIKSTQTVTHIFTSTDGENDLEKTFTFTNHETVTGTLTLTKQLLGANGTTSLSFAAGDSFTFTLFQKSGTDGGYVPYNNGSGISDGKITISSANPVTISGLPVATDAGVPYYYKIEEDALPDDSDFAFHRVKVGEYELGKSSYEFNFWDETDNRPASALTASVTFQNKLTKSDLTIKKLEKTLTSPSGTPKEGVKFELYESVPGGTGSANPVKETETTNTEGLATFENLDIYDANGELKQYYIKETKVSDDYTVTYPATNESQDYWGPIKLAEDARVTDLTGTPVTNTKQEISLTIKKVDNNNAAKAGAEFTVEKQNGDAMIGTFTTGTDGTVAVTVDDGLEPGTYRITETTVPAGLLPTGSVSQTGVDASDFKSDTTNSQLTAEITIDALEKPTVTFKNDIKPTLTVTKTVDGTVQTAKDFTFALYTMSGEAYQAVKDGEGNPITFQNGDTISLDLGTYYVLETEWPDEVLDPALNEQTTTVIEGRKYAVYGPVEITADDKNTPETLTIANYKNSATLTIQKTDAKEGTPLANAYFQVSVAAQGLSKEISTRLTGLDFNLDGTNTNYILSGDSYKTNDQGKLVINDLPVYDGDTEIAYIVTETAAPENYIKSDVPQTAKFELSNNAYVDTLSFTNIPEAQITVQKFYQRIWEINAQQPIDRPLSGATLALYKAGEGDVVSFVEAKTTDNDGYVTFTELDGTAKYYVVEVNSNGKLPTQTATEPLAVDATEYQRFTFADDFGSYPKANFDFTANNASLTQTGELTNYEGYAQFLLKKYAFTTDDDGNTVLDTDNPLAHAKFWLYGVDKTTYDAAKPNLANLTIDANRIGDYVYESGTAQFGEGTFLTERLEYGKVYWFREIEAPAGYEQPGDTLVLSPALVPWEGAVGNEISYANSSTTSIDFGNTPLPEGEGYIRYFQVEINKILVDEDGTKVKNLADAEFELYLVNDAGEEKYLTTFTTGLDRNVPADEYEEYAGRGISESFDLGKLYKKEEYQKFITPIYNEARDKIVDYQVELILRETDYPSNTSPTKIEYKISIDTSETSGGRPDTTITLDTTYTEANSIRNIQADLVTVRIKKEGVAYGDTTDVGAAEGVAGAIFEVTPADGGTTYTQTTDADGYAYFTLEPNTQYTVRESSAPLGYESAATYYYRTGEPKRYTYDDENPTGKFTTPGLRADIEAYTQPIVIVRNQQARTVTITKETNDASVESVTLRITKSGDDTFYADNLADNASGTEAAYFDLEIAINPATRTGKVQLDLLSGTYLIEETKINGIATTEAQKVNFSLINNDGTDGKVTLNVNSTDATNTKTLKNPGTGRLTIIKENDKGKPMSGVEFELLYRAYTNSDDVTASVSGTASVNGSVSELTGVTVTQQELTTDDEGMITLEGLVPGWYRLTEKPSEANENHVLAEAKAFNVGDGSFGGAEYTEVERTFVNTRMAELTISKSFDAESGAEWPEDGVQIQVKLGDTLKQTVTLTEFEPVKTIHLPAGTYTVVETTAGNWYTRHTVTGSTVDGADGTTANQNVTDVWNTSATVTLVPDNADTPVTVAFTNVGNRASLTAYKEDEKGTALEGAEFVLYYTEGGKNFYYTTKDTWVLDETAAGKYTSKLVKIADETLGVISIPNIKLPDAMFTEEGATITTTTGETFYLKEVKAPDGYTIDPDAQPKQVILVAGKHDSVISEAFVNKTAVSITLTKYGKPKGVAEEATPDHLLGGAGFTLYTKNGDEFVEVEGKTGSTHEELGTLSFDNLERLAEGESYYLRETITPETHVAGKTEVYLGDTKINPVTDADDNEYFPIPGNANAALKVYNTPKSQIVVLKYDYVDKKSLPIGATFTEITGTTTIGATRTATTADPAKLPGGYEKSADGYYEDVNGVRYAVAFSTGLVDPGVYTVKETKPATGYLNIIPGDDPALQQQQTVTVGNTGEPAVVVFANVPDPDALGVTITKSVAPTTLGSLQTKDGQDITYTIGGFTKLPLAVNSAVVTDEGLTFEPAGSAATVDWEITELTIGQATYDDTNPFYADVTTKVKVECKVNKVNNVNGEWQLVGNYTVATSEAKVNSIPDGAQGIRLTYFVEGRETLPGGFTAGDVRVKIHVSQPTENKEVVPVEKIKNLATYVVKYDFVSSTGEDEAIAQDEADATAVIESEVTLPEATLTKELQDASGKVLTDISPKDEVKYVITLNVTKNGTRNGDEEWGMIDPVIVDKIPSQLRINSATYRVDDDVPTSISLAGQVIRVAPEDLELKKGQTLTVEVNCTVLDIAALVASIQNTAYAYSDYVLPLTSSNQEGASFKKSDADEYEYPSIVIPDELVLGGKKGINAQVTANVAKTQGVSINKFVSAGSETVGGSGYITVQAGGAFTYTVNVTNQSDEPITNVWIADRLPILDDGRTSRWSPALSGVVTVSDEDASVYYSTDSTGGDAVLNSYDKDQTTLPEGFEEDSTGAKTILVIVPEIAANSTVTVTIPCTAPSGEDANSAYYYMAVNNAQMLYAGGPPTPDSSSVTNVTLMPPMVSIGDRVWIDENDDGEQNEGESLTPPAVTLTLHTFDSATEQARRTTNSSGTNGSYDFDGIYPAAPKPGATGLYDDNGDVNYASLVGLARYTYRLTASLPDGYRLAEQYEQNGGSVPKVGEANRENDSNFGSTGTGNTVQTERFYVPGEDDMSYDLGLVRERVLTIEKKGDNGLNITARFNVYGPYNAVPPSISADKLVATITTNTQGGSTTAYKQGGPGYLNAYQYYVVVESDVVTDHYSTERFDVTPGAETSVTTDTDAVVNGVEAGKKYFVLNPHVGTNMNGAAQDEVTVTNEYIAEGKLIINGTKAVDGVLAKDTTFTFTLTGEEGAPMPSEKTKTATVAKGETSKTFAFPAITYTYDDVLALREQEADGGNGYYTYTLEETAGNANTGIVYDTTKYTIKVELSDTDGDGKINVYADIYKDGVFLIEHKSQPDGGDNTGTVYIPAGTMTFTNRVEGGFSVKKVEKGNAASSDDIDSFEFTLTLDSDQTFQMKKGADETTVSTTNKTYTFSLKDDETITFSGLLVGTEYTVTEKDYKSDGYVTAITIDGTATEAASGTITAAGNPQSNPQIVFTNTRDVGNLAVSKTVAGNGAEGDVNKEFTFTLELVNEAGLALANKYEYEIRKDDVTETETGELSVTLGTTTTGATTGTASFKLTHDETITIKDLPAGTKYTVTEEDYWVTDGYRTKVKVGNAETDGRTATGTIPVGTTVQTETVAYTNTRYAGALKVTKAVDEATFTNPKAQADQAYSITVTLTPPEPEKHVGGSYTVYEAGGTVKEQSKPIEGAGTQTITVSLKAGEYVQFEDLLEDTKYEVSEAYTNALKEAGFVEPEIETVEGTNKIEAFESTQVTVTNDIPVGSLSVYKTVTGDDVETDRKFQFTLTMTGADMGNDVIADVDGIYKVSGTAGFTALRVENGKATFTLEDRETITIEGIREGTVCTVEEDDYRAYGYTTTYAPSNSATIRATTPQTINVVNTREVVDLKIEKVVAGNAPQSDKEFSFTVELNNGSTGAVGVADSYAYEASSSDVTVGFEKNSTDLIATFTLKGGQHVLIKGIPAGTTYTVTEGEKTVDEDGQTVYADYKADGYLTINKVGNVQSQKRYIATGTLGTTDKTVTVTYTNTRNVGDLQVSKTVAGNDGDEGKDFDFTLTLTNEDGLKVDGEYVWKLNGKEQTTRLKVEGGEASFKLEHGQTITIEDIPAGTAYTVTEEAPSSEASYFAQGYVTTVNGGTEQATTATGTIPTDDEQQPLETVAFTNTRNVGNLTVTKTVTGEGADAPGVPTAFEVTVTLEAPTGVNLVGTVDGQNITQAEDFNSQTQTFSHTFTLADGASVVFTDLPTGTKYEVTEAYYTAEGFVTTYNTVGDVGNDQQIDANDEGECITVTVNNHRPAAGLTITKNIGGSGSSEDDEFTFKVSLTRTDDVLVDGEYNWTFNNPANEDAQTTTFNVKDGVGTVTLKGGQTVTIADIPVGTTYTVTELTESGADAVIGAIDTNGYTLTEVRGATGTIEDEKGIYTATFQNERYVGDLTVKKLVVGNAQSAPNARTEFDITVTLTAPAGVDLVGTVNRQPVQPTQTFTLEAGESVEFIGLPEGTTYVVTEADYSANGYAATFADDETGDGATADTATSANGTIVRSETGSVTATVTNTKYVGSLSVTKTTVGTGADQSKAFEFTLTLTGANGTNVNGTYDVTGIDQPTLTVENGAASFTLTHGQTITIDGIPAGTTYKVEETVPTAEGYEQPTMTGQTGTIPQDDTAQASFINRRDVGNLTVTKIVAGNGEGSPNALTAFDITVELTAPAGVDLVGTVNNGQPVQPTQTFTLTDGQSVRFVGLPEGTQYEVSEADYSANGYETTYTAKTGNIEATLESAAGVISTVTNTLDTRSLSVSKIVSGSGAETDKAFTFQLTLVNNDLNVNGTYQVEGVEQQTLTVEGGRASFTLTGGQTITILGIPENTRYLVTENDYIADGYVTSEPDNAQGQLNGQNATVAFTNTRDVGELTIQKTVNGALGDANRDFEFTLTLVPGENGVPVDGTYDATLHTAAGSEATTVSVEDGVSEAILLSGGERLVIHELPAGASYIVREASYQSLGYDTSASGQTGTIPATGSMPVAGFTNTRNGGSLIIEKALAGNAPIDTDTFEFTVTLSHPDGVDLNGSYQTLVNGEPGEPVEFVGGEATVQITGAGTLEILGILAETDYEVTENLPATSDYELISSEGETGAIPVDDAATASFTNERNVGSLTLSKAVAGNAAETDREFDFTVFMTDRYGRNLNGAYAMRGDAGSSVTFTNGYASISLYAGQSATIDGILEGTYYSVTEDDANTDGYVTTSSGTTGLIGTGTSTASFLNTRNVTEEFTSVTVYKAWNDEDDADGVRPESITVYLYADGEAVDSAVLTAAGGWSTVFDGLPVYSAAGEAITYRVIEVSTVDYFASYAYAASIVNITNTHNPDDFTPRTPDDPMLLTLIEDNIIPLGGNVNMNEGDCFN